MTIHYSAREAAALLGRSYPWLDQRVRAGDFVGLDGTVIEPVRTAGGYRRFDVPTLMAIAFSCYRHRWFGMSTLRSVLFELARAEARDNRVVCRPSG
jgi:hypothetical protein